MSDQLDDQEPLPPACVDCRHYHRRGSLHSRGLRHECTAAPWVTHSIITGNVTSHNITCREARGPSGKCGYEGRLFVPRPPRAPSNAVVFWRRVKALLGGASHE